MAKSKPFSRAEMKVLIYKKMKNGMSYAKACEQLNQEVEQIIENDATIKREKKNAEKEDARDRFREEFIKLKNEE